MGDQTPRALLLTPREAEELAEGCEGMAAWIRQDAPSGDPAELEQRSERLVMLDHLRLRLLALHHGEGESR